MINTIVWKTTSNICTQSVLLIALEWQQPMKIFYVSLYYTSKIFSYQLNKTSLDTSDVKAVIATVVNDSTVSIQCTFIYGSDAMGCRVVLVSDHSSVGNEAINIYIQRHDQFGSGRFSLVYPVSCYSEVLASDIEFNNVLSDVKIVAKLQQPLNTQSCSGLCILSTLYCIGIAFNNNSYSCCCFTLSFLDSIYNFIFCVTANYHHFNRDFVSAYHTSQEKVCRSRIIPKYHHTHTHLQLVLLMKIKN